MAPHERSEPAALYQTGAYLALNPSYHVEDSKWKATQLHRLLGAKEILPGSIAEIGCGAGAVLAELACLLPLGVRFHGWDVSGAAIELASSRASDYIKFSKGDFLVEDREYYDVVLCVDVFEHVEDYIGFIRALRSRGTWKVFHIPLEISVQSVMRMHPILKGRRRLGHLHHFTKETALATLEDCGYEVAAWNYTAGALDLPDRSNLQKLARVPRRLARAISPDLAARWLGGFSLAVLAR